MLWKIAQMASTMATYATRPSTAPTRNFIKETEVSDDVERFDGGDVDSLTDKEKDFNLVDQDAFAESKLRELTELLHDIRIQHNSSQDFLKEKIDKQDRQIVKLNSALNEAKEEIQKLQQDFTNSEKHSRSIISQLQSNMQTIIEATSHISVKGGAVIELKSLSQLQRNASNEKTKSIEGRDEVHGEPSINTNMMSNSSEHQDKPIILPASKKGLSEHLDVPSYAKMRADEKAGARVEISNVKSRTVPNNVQTMKSLKPNSAMYSYRKSLDGPIISNRMPTQTHMPIRSSYEDGSLSLRYAVASS